MGSHLLIYPQSECSCHHKDVVEPFVCVEKSLLSTRLAQLFQTGSREWLRLSRWIKTGKGTGSRGNEKLFSSSVLSQQKYQTHNLNSSCQTTTSGATCSTSRRGNLGTVNGAARPPPDDLQELLPELIQDKGKIPFGFPMAQIVAPSLPPQIAKGFLDKCFSISDENTIYGSQFMLKILKC